MKIYWVTIPIVYRLGSKLTYSMYESEAVTEPISERLYKYLIKKKVNGCLPPASLNKK